MKLILQILAIITILSISKNVVGQKDSTIKYPPEYAIITEVEEPPSFPGGEEARIKYFQEHAKPPNNWRSDSINGKVFVTFIVKSNGNISNVKILRGLNPVLDSIALNAIIAMPKWNPAKQSDKPVDCMFNLPIKFGNQYEIKKTYCISQNSRNEQLKIVLLTVRYVELDIENPFRVDCSTFGYVFTNRYSIITFRDTIFLRKFYDKLNSLKEVDSDYNIDVRIQIAIYFNNGNTKMLCLGTDKQIMQYDCIKLPYSKDLIEPILKYIHK